MRSPVVIMGIPIDRVSMGQAIDEIERLVRLGRERGTTHQVATVNVDFVVNAVREVGVKRILQHADLVLADGMPLVWASARVGVPIPGRVAGADLVPALAERSAATGLRIHLFGSADGVAEKARHELLARSPGARITADSGPMIRDPRAVDLAVLQQLVDIDADVICVAFGNPKQEHFIDAIRSSAAAPVMIGVGGTLDMLVGGRKRAPQWIQRVGLEWVFRAMQEPRRLGKRYANDIIVFGPHLAGFLWKARKLRDVVAPDLDARSADGAAIDLGAITCMPLTVLGELVARRRAAHQLGATLRLTGAGSTLVEQLRSLGAEGLLETPHVDAR